MYLSLTRQSVEWGVGVEEGPWCYGICLLCDTDFPVSGLFLTYLGLYLMNGHGQPALLYLVPCTLGNWVIAFSFWTYIYSDLLLQNKPLMCSSQNFASIHLVTRNLCPIGFSARRAEKPLEL